MFRSYFFALSLFFISFASFALSENHIIEVIGGFDGANPQSQDSIIQESSNRFRIKPFNEKGSNDSYYFRFNTRVINQSQNPQPLELIIEWPALLNHPDYPYDTYYYGDMGKWKWTYAAIEETEAKIHIHVPPGITYVGCYPRYNYNYLEEFLSKIQETKELKKWVVGKSFFNRNIWCIKITDPDVPSVEKTTVLLTARNHPYETSGSYITEEIVRYLQKSHDLTAARLKKEHIIYIIPVLNPDGVALGLNQQTRPGGVNISYGVESDDPAVKTLLKTVDNFRPVLWADIHSWPHKGDDGMWCTHKWIADELLAAIPNRTFNNYIWDVSFVNERNTKDNHLWQWLIRTYNSGGVSLSISWYRRNEKDMRQIAFALINAVCDASNVKNK